MDLPLRIAIALPGLHRVQRGAETAFEQIAAELAKLGHQVTVFGSGHPSRELPYRYSRIPCIPREFFEKWPRLPALRTHYAWEELSFSFGLLLRFRPDDYDITLACSYPYMNWLLRRGASAGRPRHVFVTQNGDWMIQAQNAEYRFFDCDGLVCTNAQYFDRHGQRYPSVLIPNGVDPSLFHPGPADRAAYGLPATGPIALMVSALIPSKRVVEGINAVAGVPDLFLAVAGDGECRDEVDRQANRLLPGRFLRFTLPREKMPGLYRCADLFLHMSREEASANAYMEALATGLPIVTHNWEVTRWTLQDAAHLVDCTDTAAVAAALRQALQDRSADAVARRRELAQRRFAWSSIAARYSEFFQQLSSPAGVSPPVAAPDNPLADVGVVAIGRNEGDRLGQCLASVRGKTAAIIYVDSGSTDQSLSLARQMGADIIELDTTLPFTAARARNIGVERLLQIAPQLKYVQFVDGDCQVRSSWLARARRELQADPTLAAVCGRRRERFPHQSVYNRLIDMEWNTPIGPAKSVGGDALFRLDAFHSVQGFDPTVMAGEEPQLCLRLRHSGWNLRRIPAEMTLHDANILRFGQWWRRQLRGGYGAIDVFTRFPIDGERLFAKPTRSALLWAAGWPTAVVLAAIIALPLGGPGIALLAAAVVFLALPAQIARLSLVALRAGQPPAVAVAYGTLTMIGKWAWLCSRLRYRRDRAAGKIGQLIEYKNLPGQPAEAT